MMFAHRQSFTLVASLGLAAASAAWGGPNAAGTLILHDAGIIYTDLPSLCGQGSILSTCEQVDSRIDTNGESSVVWKIYAAFPPCGSSPRLAAVYFGVQYDPEVYVLQQHSCGTTETPTANWPASGSGLQVFWDPPRLETLAEVCWFAGYSYPAPATADFWLGPHPAAGGMFVDDLVPPNLDPIAGYGTLGFNQPGQPVCVGWNYGACCHVDGTCSVTSEGQCHAPDTWIGCLVCSPDACWIMDTGNLPTAPFVTSVRIVPNPVRDQAIVQFRVVAARMATIGPSAEARATESRPTEEPAATAVTVGIYDAAGRQIRQIFSGMAGMGMQSIPWDCRDVAGRFVPAGAYYIRLESRGESRCAPVVILN
jgi:hypothetical protein